MNELFLGIIAVSVLVMAIIQVAAIVVAARAAQRLTAMTARLEQDIRPVITHLQSAAVDASRSAAMAAAQVERADRLLTDATDRLERIFATVQSTATQIHQTVSGAGRMSGAWLAGIKAVMSAYRELREAPRKRRPAPVDEEDSLFIG